MRESLRAFGAVFRNVRLRRLQLAGAGSTLGSWAYGVGLAVYAYDAGGARWVGLVYFAASPRPPSSPPGSPCSSIAARGGG